MIDIFIRDINGKRIRKNFFDESSFNQHDWSWFDDENYEIQMVLWYCHCIYNSLSNDKIYLADLRGFFCMKIWVDDVRPAPKGYYWLKSVNEAKRFIADPHIQHNYKIELIDIDHDAGDYAQFGGDYIKLLDWLEETGLNYPIHIHSMNPVGVANMRRIICRNNWTEI